LGKLPELEQIQAEKERRRRERIWTPYKGRPQEQAYYSEADELFYGGAAGGGKSDLLLGLSATAHYKSIIFRREFPQFEHLIERSHELFDGIGIYNEQKSLWRLQNGRQIKFAAVQYMSSVSKFQGRPHDLIGFDEISNFLEMQYLFLSGWARTVVQGQRVRRVCAGNPPTNADGEWVLKRWGAWLDGQHSHPALPGELRWYASIEGKDTEVEDGTPFEHKGKRILPLSRTFIPARLQDNPAWDDGQYEAVLQSMAEPLRSQLLDGDFGVGQEDNAWQVIPTDWVRQAQARWSEENKPVDEKGEAIPLSCIGQDVAHGGKDETVLQRRYANWYAWAEAYPGSMTPTGAAAALLAVKALAEEDSRGAYVNIDVIGWGAAAYESLAEQDVDVIPINFANHVLNMDRSGTMRFANMRAWAYWSLREALDPEKGEGLMIPPDSELLADLTAVRWEPRISGVQLEDKEKVKERIGRSPNKGDAFVLASLPDMSPRLS
jgi:hypothetical protein